MLAFYILSVTVLAINFTKSLFSISLVLGYSLVIVFDDSSFIFLITLLVVSLSVILWSYYYIDSETSFRCFFFVVLSFLFSMICLVSSGSLLSLLLSWDLLGFTSLFLVFYYRSRASLSGGLLTGAINRLGDCLFLVLLSLSLLTGGRYTSIFFYLIILIAITKSAQVPFSSWLPAAMVAPTPVSALVHSSTLVTAGVYLLYRFLTFEAGSLLIIGCFTILTGSTAAALEVDIKRIVAYSTLSQLGVMVISLGIGERGLCFLHLNLHAMFKALLFISVGILIHSCYGSQESRSLFTFSSSAVWPLFCIFVSRLSMSGLFFLSGWVSKEAILEASYNSRSPFLATILFYLGIVLTLVYRFRLLLLCMNSSSGFIALRCNTPCICLVFYPTLVLLLFSCSQGVLLSKLSLSQLSVLSVFDKLIIILLWGASLLLSHLSMFILIPSISNFISFSYLVHYSSSLIVKRSYPKYLEVSPVQGFGLASSSRFVNRISRSKLPTLRVFLFFRLLFLF